MDIMEKRELQAFAVKIRIAALDALNAVGMGHIGGIMSVADLLAVLYGREMRINVADPQWPERDKLVCSKGHAGASVYGTLALKGYFPYEELQTMNKPETRLPSHCDRTKTPGIDMTTGSLGQGTSLACGMALGDKLKGRDNRVFLIVGDGETNEGQVWEAFNFASAYKLGNLVVCLDWNKRQLDGYTEEIYPIGDLQAKMKAFGFKTVVIDGADVEAIAAALEWTRSGGDQPYCILMDTVKGAGIEDVVNTHANHSMSISKENYEKWTAQLRAELEELEG